MVNSLALASIKSYLFDALVWIIIGGIIFTIGYFVFKRNWLAKIILGVLLLVAVIPTIFMTLISSVGCCGESNPNALGGILGIALGVVMGVTGIALIVYGVKTKP